MIHLSYLTIGDFDGVHLGHGVILSETVKKSKENKQTSICLTFSNNSKKYFGKTTELITDFDYKKLLISKYGFNQIESLEFNNEIASLSGEKFFERIIEKYNIHGFVCGSNFRCGVNAEFDCEAISKMLSTKKIAFITIPTNNFSSTAIRTYIKNGNIKKANSILGRDFSYCAPVISGNHIGTQIGFPTFNQTHLDGYLIPSSGVYATYILHNGFKFPAVTNIGSRPTITDSQEIIIETHLLDYKNIYLDSEIPLRVYFVTKIREEKKFSSLNELKVQIKKDVEKAKVLL